MDFLQPAGIVVTRKPMPSKAPVGSVAGVEVRVLIPSIELHSDVAVAGDWPCRGTAAANPRLLSNVTSICERSPYQVRLVHQDQTGFVRKN